MVSSAEGASQGQPTRADELESLIRKDWMATEARRYKNPSPWVVAALIGFLVASTAAIVLILLRNTTSTSSIRVEAQRELLISEMESAVQVASVSAATFAGQLGNMAEAMSQDGSMSSPSSTSTDPADTATGVGDIDGPNQSGARSVLTEQPELLLAIGSFWEAAGELREIMPASEQPALEDAVTAHEGLIASIASLEVQAGAPEDAMAFYHSDTQVIEAALRNNLQDLQRASSRRLQASIEDVRSAQSMLRLIVPMLLLGALVASVYLVRLGLARRRIMVLEGLVRAKDDFVSAVSHELRTPLTGVVGFADVLHEAGSDLSPHERAEIVASLAEQSHEVAAIVDDLLASAHTENGELTVVTVPINCRAQAAQVLEVIAQQSNRSIEITGDAPKAYGDPARVRQILRNLLSNAARYGGDQISIELDGDPLFASLRITDNGEPIPMEDRQRIFESYERAHHLPGAPGSIGLGLAVSRRLARLMGGDLTYDHRNGHSVFELTLPVAARADAPSHRSVETAAQS